MTMAYNIGGIDFNTETPDELGVLWYCAMTGWDSPDTRGLNTPKNNDDGEYDGPQFYSARSLEITSWARCPDEDTYYLAKEKLGDVLEINQPISVISSEVIPKSVTGVRSGKLLARQGNIGTQLDSNFVIRCKDPLKYGPSERAFTTLPSINGLVPPLVAPWIVGSAGGSAVVSNTGKYKTGGIITFTGPVPGPFRAVNTRQGRKIELAMTLAAGDVLTVNLRTGATILNGAANRRGAITNSSRFWLFQKGLTTVNFEAAQFAAGTMTIDYAPAWIL